MTLIESHFPILVAKDTGRKSTQVVNEREWQATPIGYKRLLRGDSVMEWVEQSAVGQRDGSAVARA